MRVCCGVGIVNTCTDGGNSAKVEVIVVHDKRLGFDLLVGIDAMTALGGIRTTQAGAVRFCSKEIPTCVGPG